MRLSCCRSSLVSRLAKASSNSMSGSSGLNIEVFPFLNDPEVEGDPQACGFTEEFSQFKIRLEVIPIDGFLLPFGRPLVQEFQSRGAHPSGETPISKSASLAVIRALAAHPPRWSKSVRRSSFDPYFCTVDKPSSPSPEICFWDSGCRS